MYKNACMESSGGFNSCMKGRTGLGIVEKVEALCHCPYRMMWFRCSKIKSKCKILREICTVWHSAMQLVVFQLSASDIP